MPSLRAAPPAAAPMPPAPGSAAPATAGCPTEMVEVTGRYCPTVVHRCLRHTREYDREQQRRTRLKAEGKVLPMSRVSERCLEYAKPSRCLAETRTPMRFCIDRYEWPGAPGADALLLVSWTEAEAHCAGAGKRLCTEAEFNFACEGDDILPYSYGYKRDPERCNIDRRYVTPKRLLPHDACVASPRCRADLAEIDQRRPIGSDPQCTSPFGVHDLNGNLNEWVRRPGQTAPYRSGLKGGWWGPARSRCRPMVTVHDENYVGYEVGFRCCQDAAAGAAEGAGNAAQSAGGSQNSSGTPE